MRELILGDSLEALLDHRGKTPKKLGADFTTSGVPVVSALLVSGGRLHLGQARFVSEGVYRRWMPAPAKAGDVLLTSEGPLGRVAVVPDDRPLVLGQRLFALRGRAGVLHSGYLYYALQTEYLQGQLLARSTGTTVHGIRQSALRDVRVPAPSFGEQRAIAEVLGALDDRIASNDRTRDLAHAAMLACYRRLVESGRHWSVVEEVVVRLNPPRPVSKDELVADGRTPVLDQSESGILGYTSRTDSLDASAASPVLFFGDHTCRLGIATEPFLIGPNTIPFTGNGVPSLVLYCALHGVQQSEEYRRHWGTLVKKAIALPEAGGAVGFAETFVDVLRLIRQLDAETRTVRSLGAALLPALMSGKLSVGDAGRVVETTT